MLGFLFGFNARLGRLHYFLASLGLGVLMVALGVAVVGNFLINNNKSASQLAWPLIVLAVIFVAASLSLQCMRIRDIGWDPVLVMPTWIAICIVDHLVATKIPSLSLDPFHSGTVVGSLFNLGMVLALWFWPSGDHVASPPRFDSSAWEPDEEPAMAATADEADESDDFEPVAPGEEPPAELRRRGRRGGVRRRTRTSI